MFHFLWWVGTFFTWAYIKSQNEAGLDWILWPISFAVWFFISWTVKKERNAAIARANNRIHDIIRPHVRALATRHKQLVKADHYGVIDGKPWSREVEKFWQTVVIPQITPEQFKYFNHKSNAEITAFSIIYDHIRPVLAKAPIFDDVDPVAYEHFCADLLKSIGWNARVTKASGDQGADIIAQLDDILVVIQCKLYSRPVGTRVFKKPSQREIMNRPIMG